MSRSPDALSRLTVFCRNLPKHLARFRRPAWARQLGQQPVRVFCWEPSKSLHSSRSEPHRPLLSPGQGQGVVEECTRHGPGAEGTPTMRRLSDFRISACWCLCPDAPLLEVPAFTLKIPSLGIERAGVSWARRAAVFARATHCVFVSTAWHRPGLGFGVRSVSSGVHISDISILQDNKPRNFTDTKTGGMPRATTLRHLLSTAPHRFRQPLRACPYLPCISIV